MGFLMALWAIVVGALADEARVRSRIPKVAPQLDRLAAQSDGIGLGTAGFGAFAFLYSIWRLLGLLGLPYATLPMIWALCCFTTASLLVLLGFIYAVPAMHSQIGNIKTEEAVLAARERLFAFAPLIGRAAWVGGLALLVLTILV